MGHGKHRRSPLHYILLASMAWFLSCTVLFIAAALKNLFTGNSQAALYFAALAIACGLSSAFALIAFCLRWPRPGTLVIGLLLIQPGLSALSRLVAARPFSTVNLIISAIGGSTLLGYWLLTFLQSTRRPVPDHASTEGRT